MQCTAFFHEGNKKQNEDKKGKEGERRRKKVRLGNVWEIRLEKGGLTPFWVFPISPIDLGVPFLSGSIWPRHIYLTEYYLDPVLSAAGLFCFFPCRVQRQQKKPLLLLLLIKSCAGGKSER